MRKNYTLNDIRKICISTKCHLHYSKFINSNHQISSIQDEFYQIVFDNKIAHVNLLLFHLKVIVINYQFSLQRCLCRVEAVKSRPVHSIRDVIFPILRDRSARHYCCACGNFSFNFSAFSIFGWFQYSYLNILNPP
jgi:hypothetical protein